MCGNKKYPHAKCSIHAQNSNLTSKLAFCASPYRYDSTSSVGNPVYSAYCFVTAVTRGSLCWKHVSGWDMHFFHVVFIRLLFYFYFSACSSPYHQPRLYFYSTRQVRYLLPSLPPQHGFGVRFESEGVWYLSSAHTCILARVLFCVSWFVFYFQMVCLLLCRDHWPRFCMTRGW